MWKALLNLAKQGKFRGPTVPCFFGSSEKDYGAHRKASDGEYGVYDLMPNAGDKFATYRNSDSRSSSNADYYITADGKSGIIVRHVEAGAPYCLFYGHWQGLNPVNGLGWKAFNTVVERIRKHLEGRRGLDASQRDHRPLPEGRRVELLGHAVTAAAGFLCDVLNRVVRVQGSGLDGT